VLTAAASISWASADAYVSGMKEDVGLEGNALNYLNVAYCELAPNF